jgi:hypothetical protein
MRRAVSRAPGALPAVAARRRETRWYAWLLRRHSNADHPGQRRTGRTTTPARPPGCPSPWPLRPRCA